MNDIERPIVAKFGGTSVASKEAILTVVEIVRCLIRRPVLVVSAVSGITDALLKRQIELVRTVHERLVNELFPDIGTRLEIIDYVNQQLKIIGEISKKANLSPAETDRLVSFGEIISSYIISKVLQAHGIASEQVIATKMIVTDDNFTKAEFLLQETQENVRNILRPLIEKGIVPVVTGFIGSTRNGKVTTLGRGGSDYSASIIGFCLKASEIQIWTDVDGVYTANPRIVKNAQLLPVVSYEQALLLAESGAKVLHPKTMGPALKGDIPIRVLNTFNIQNSGTLVTRVKGG